MFIRCAILNLSYIAQKEELCIILYSSVIGKNTNSILCRGGWLYLSGDTSQLKSSSAVDEISAELICARRNIGYSTLFVSLYIYLNTFTKMYCTFLAAGTFITSWSMFQIPGLSVSMLDPLCTSWLVVYLGSSILFCTTCTVLVVANTHGASQTMALTAFV